MTVMAFDPTRTTNAQLMVDCLELGYLPSEGEHVFDATYGLGSFWGKFIRGEGKELRRGSSHWFNLTRNDINPDLDVDTRIDYTQPSGWWSRSFHTVVFDPPYKLNGTPTPSVDGRYGVGEAATMESRLDGIRSGLWHLQRLADRFLLVKVQDQVSGGKVRWMTGMVESEMLDEPMGGHKWKLRDQLYVSSYRPQPSGRTQLHARRNYSTLMVFERTT